MGTNLTNPDNGVQLVYNIGGQLTTPGIPTEDNKHPAPIVRGRWEFGYKPGTDVMTMNVDLNSGIELVNPCANLNLISHISPDGIIEINRWLCTVSSQIAALPKK